MRSILKKLHNITNPSEDAEWSTPSRANKSGNDGSLSDNNSNMILHSQSHHHGSQLKSNSGLSSWLNSVSQKYNSLSTTSSSSTMAKEDGVGHSDSVSSAGLDLVSSSTNSRDLDIEEEYQIQLALEISAKEDPEAVQIEAVKQISLGSCPQENTPAEVVAFRYWDQLMERLLGGVATLQDPCWNFTYNALVYDDKILDGFYDVYEIMSESILKKMPSLVDLQGTQLSESVTWEAILVDHAVDANLLKLEQEAMVIASNSRCDFQVFVSGNLVQKLAILVANCMGGPVRDPNNISIAWRSLSYSLKSTLGSLVFPIGSLTIGLSRHRALLFKVLTDTLGIPCCLVKGQQHAGFDGMAMNFVKLDDGREYIVDLMADPGTLIPSDAYGLQKGLLFSATPSSKDDHCMLVSSISNKFSSSFGEHPGVITLDNELDNPNLYKPSIAVKESKENSYDFKNFSNVEISVDELVSMRPIQSLSHARSPSWTEGVSSPTARKMNVKDVSQYMIDAAKLNPQLAQKLDDVLLESGVIAPPNLFTEIYSEQSPHDDKDRIKETKNKIVRNDHCLPPLPHNVRSKQLKCSNGLEINEKAKKVPVAAAAAAAAVASSMVVAVANSRTDLNMKIPVSAAATATAAAMAATTAAINKYGQVNKRDVVESGFETDNNYDLLINREVKYDGALGDVAECEVAWDDITFGERIGLGSYGEIYHGELHGTEVAVKKFLSQDFSGESLEEFKSEVRLMRKLRHPNVVLFMGAITRPPNLSIVTEFLPRGSLYRLIHRPNNQLDERRRLRMALDTARGMNYLHNCTPMIVHRDLKSPNLLVDKNWIVKVCDFGLSRMKHNTFLSSRSTAGTAEWMAPEVLRNEPSDEKCDVYSFGVVLWELCTLQQPWRGMNPMQVVGAVGFQHRRLDIPDDIDPAVASIIRSCWHPDPKARPSFSEIMASMKPLQKPIATNSHPHRPSSCPSTDVAKP